MPRPYPTREGIAVPLHEVYLPSNDLDLGLNHNVNRHHREWSRRKFGKFLITRTLRDLTELQDILPVNIHNWLHTNYDQPKFPTPGQAMARLSQAYFSDETLSKYSGGKYRQSNITPELWTALNKEYEEVKW